MEKSKLNELFETAYNYCEINHRDVLEWANNINEDTFEKIDQ